MVLVDFVKQKCQRSLFPVSPVLTFTDFQFYLNLNILFFCVGRTKQETSEEVKSVFHSFLTFHRRNNEAINLENNQKINQ